MIIWLKHPQHGMKDCYSENEAIECEKNGWARFDRDANKPKEVVVDAPDADTVVEKPAQTDRKKPGPKPKAKV